ncbi:unnamed protein product [Ostreobium quekettii]|uniref:VASt domain-containing protein n=1 Tax=Ostreobium quekettii TaxID=121088 RepID=A0A8S1ILH0_9CHLO|nr:unnamed protein product [Ostreobium quekettii]|eukprot:evm.model.scf_7.3 EVM.evm.TU.scf_7.3   scf_7:9784-15087(+)
MPGLALAPFTAEQFDAFWPRWRHADKSGNLLHCELRCSVEKVRDMLFAPEAKFQEKLHKVRRDSNIAKTAWLEDFRDLPSLPSGYDWTVQLQDADYVNSRPRRGLIRKVHFTSAGISLHPSPFNTEECQRCVEYVPSKRLVVEVCVISTPPYCDRFRPINMYQVESIGNGWCTVKVDYQIVYIAAVNFVLRTFIERSAKDGMLQNFEKMAKAFDSYVETNNLRKKSKTEKKTPRLTAKDIRSFPIDDLPFEIVEQVEKKDRGLKAFVMSDRLHRDASAFMLALIFPLRILMILPAVYKWLQGVPSGGAAADEHPNKWHGLGAMAQEFFRALSRLLLSLCVAYVIHNAVLGTRMRCEGLGGRFAEACEVVFELVGLPVEFRALVSSGLFMAFVVKFVELGLVTR